MAGKAYDVDCICGAKGALRQLLGSIFISALAVLVSVPFNVTVTGDFSEPLRMSMFVLVSNETSPAVALTPFGRVTLQLEHFSVVAPPALLVV